jgi:hypothetical protein
VVGVCGRQVVDRVARGARHGVEPSDRGEPGGRRRPEQRNFDSSTFESWFTAYTVGNKTAMRLAEHRFRPEFKVAFDAWLATKPETNPEAQRGPTYMPQYKRPGAAEARIGDARAKAAFLDGEKDGSTADKYIRLTVVLASILFLVGISTHFPYRGVRYGLIGLGIALLVLSLTQLSQLPLPPS